MLKIHSYIISSIPFSLLVSKGEIDVQIIKIPSFKFQRYATSKIKSLLPQENRFFKISSLFSCAYS
jgi:hypothetical protein